jgi:photosystem II stability/assembly factor-like uncharacterized protein
VSYRRVACFAAVLTCIASAALSQQIDPRLFGALHWRLIGPFRAGRVSAGAVDPGDPNTYYLGAAGGGVWKTTNGGETWRPIFDATGVASIGALAIAPSDRNVIYAGTGEETRGNGVYKSTDGGSTWTNVGLTQTHFIGAILISPANPDVVLVAAIGDREPGPSRGVFRSTDGGRTWTNVLFRDPASGCPSIIAAPDNPDIIFATLYPGVAARGVAPAPPMVPGAPATPPIGAATSVPQPPAAIYKSTDGGATWRPLAAKGLPAAPVGRQAFGAIAGTRGERLFAGLREGLFRSDDGGETWERWTTDPRIRPFGVITDPRDANVLYVTQTSLYRSTDGGRTFDAYAGAPSGDDFQLLWIDPRNSRRLLAGVDQGGIVSVDGGETWSSWYNQPTGQFYHVSTDNRFPYHVFAAQQDSGSVAVPNRSDFGELSYRDWYSPGGFEFGYLAADPLNPDVVFAGGWYRTVVRFDRKTGQIAHVFVPGTKYRSVNNAPLGFSPQDPRTLYLGTQFLMKTTDGGNTWREASPDLTDVPGKTVPAVIGPRGAQGASITTFSASTAKTGVIWVGTTNAVVQLTQDAGFSWRHVSPPDLPPGGAFEIIDAGRHDPATAYAAFIVPQDTRPYIYRTHDNGTTWRKIVTGLPDNAIARVVREDPVRKGLLYCGTETGVYVSFDDGDHWQSLQLNLPASSMRDMVVQGDDLVLATYGRALWILDNVSPLRQIDPQFASGDARLFAPASAVRVRWDVYGDTPLPIETPTAPNPPDGALIDYYLPHSSAGDLSLTIYDSRGAVVRTYSSVAPPEPTLLGNVPSYWFAPPPALTKDVGMNRFVWNLRLPNPKVLPFAYSGGLLNYVEYTLADHAIPGQTPRDQPEGALVVPGQYIVELTVAGRTDRQRLSVKPDPRVRASPEDLLAQFDAARRVTEALAASHDGYSALAKLRAALGERQSSLAANAAARETASVAKALDERLNAIQHGTPSARGLGLVNRDMARYFNMLESSDTRPAEMLRGAIEETCDALTLALSTWRDLSASDLPAFNAQLRRLALAPLPDANSMPAAPACR